MNNQRLGGTFPENAYEGDIIRKEKIVITGCRSVQMERMFRKVDANRYAYKYEREIGTNLITGHQSAGNISREKIVKENTF